MKNNSARKKNRILLGLGVGAGVLGGLVAWRRIKAAKQRPVWPVAGHKSGAALITGASSGIGAAFARRLAAEGYDLLLVARREERLAALAAELQQRYSIQAEILVADLADPMDVKRVEEWLVEIDTLSILINNAGFGISGHFAGSDLARELDMIHVHLNASVRLSRAALPGMIARQRGAIINVSSVAAFIPTPGAVTYSATKSYLNVFSEAVQAELGGTGVRVQALCPGFTHTEFHDTPEYEHSSHARIPEILWLSAEEVVTESLHALERGPVICIPGLKYRFFVSLIRNPLLWPFLRWIIFKWREQEG